MRVGVAGVWPPQRRRERDGDLSVRGGGHFPRSVVLSTAGDTGDRTRWLGTDGLLTTAAKDLAGAGPTWMGDSDEVEVVLKLRNIFLAVGTIHRCCWRSLGDSMSSFAVGRSAVTIVGAFYDALVAGVTVTAEYEGANGANGARGGDLVLRRVGGRCLPTQSASRLGGEVVIKLVRGERERMLAWL